VALSDDDEAKKVGVHLTRDDVFYKRLYAATTIPPVVKFVRPGADFPPGTAPGGWSTIPTGGQPYWQQMDEIAPDTGAGTNAIRFTGGLGIFTLVLDTVGGYVDPGTDVGWVWRMTARTNIGGGVIPASALFMDCSISNRVGALIKHFKMGTPNNDNGATPVDVTLSNVYTQYVIPLTVPEAAAFSFALGPGGQPWQMQFRFSVPFYGVTDTIDISQWEMQLP
jgi:hypothetical protein